MHKCHDLGDHAHGHMWHHIYTPYLTDFFVNMLRSPKVVFITTHSLTHTPFRVHINLNLRQIGGPWRVETGILHRTADVISFATAIECISIMCGTIHTQTLPGARMLN